MRVSAVILSRPNDHLLRGCVEKARKWADEIVIGRCGQNIDEPCDVKVVLEEDMVEAYGFAYVRNRIDQKASGDWLIRIDTDEELDCSKERLHEIIRVAEHVGRQALQVTQHHGGQHSEHQWRGSKRGSGLKWRGLVHEELYLADAHASSVSSSQAIPLIHHGPNLESKREIVKQNHLLYAELLMRGFHIPALRAGTNTGWYGQISGNYDHWRQSQLDYWERRGVPQLHHCYMHPYATHQPILIDLIHSYDDITPRVVEFGTGMYSTPLLHQLCYTESYETNLEWARLMRQFGAKCVPRLQDVPVKRCDIVFIDGPFGEIDKGESRGELAERWAHEATFLVCHDAESLDYGWEHSLPKFKYKYTDVRLTPWTAVVSNHVDLSFLGGGLKQYIPVVETHPE